MQRLGKHILLEFMGCSSQLLNSKDALEPILNEAAKVMGASIVESRFHNFSPIGVSGVVIIMESHLTIHTWPEYDYAAIDIFTCGKINFDEGVELLKKKLKPQSVTESFIERGIQLQIPVRQISEKQGKSS